MYLGLIISYNRIKIDLKKIVVIIVGITRDTYSNRPES